MSSNHIAGVRLLAESIERGLNILGKDETQMEVKRQDVEDLRGVLAEVERLRAKIEAALALIDQYEERNNDFGYSNVATGITAVREALKGEEG